MNASVSSLSEIKRTLLQKYLRSHVSNKGGEQGLIAQRPLGEPVPLSFCQQQIWLHEQLAGEIPFYNETITIYRQGPLDAAVLERCFIEIIRRHEIWRTTFETPGGEPVQIVHPTPNKFCFPIVDLRNASEEGREAEAKRLATEDARRPFDLKGGPLLRVFVVHMAEEQYRLYLTFHQIIFDAITAYRVFLPELTKLYEAFSLGKPSPLPETRIQYGDFSYWQRREFSKKFDSEHVAHWQRQLSGELPVLQWPTERPRPSIETHRGAIHRFTFPRDLIRDLRELSQREGTSLYMVLLAGFVAVLHRYTAQEDIILASLTAGRKQTELESLLGYFVNPLALRINVSGNPTFRELQSRVRSVVLDALAHEEVPFGEILRQIQFKQDPSRNPIFQIIFSQQPRLADIPPGWSLVTEEISNGGSKVDLVIVVDDRGEEISGPITYNPDLFQESTITRMVGHWETLLKAVCVNIDQPVARLPILTEAERNQILFEWNATHADYPNNICLHELIETQAEQTPDAEAVIYNEQRLTYRQLNARANQLAHRLRELGAGPEVLIGICMERSIEMVVALLGVLKAGAAYLPLDPEYPKERLRIILDDSRPIVLLTQQRLLTQLPPCDLKVIALDSEWNQIASQSSSNPTRLAGPDNVAYAIYTSGSTGRPKGVLNIHRGIVNRLIWMQDAYSLTPDDRVLQKTPYGFDVSVWEFFWPLISGAALVIAKPGGHKDPDYLLALIQREKVTTTHFVPSMLQVFLEVDGLEACHNLKRVICSGEALPYEVQKRFFARLQAELHNLYGPTEAAVDVTYWQCRPDSGDPIVPIGRPIANVQIYLLDENLQPVPIGVAGQLHIGGVALARGYLNRRELTAEKFIPDPFSAQPGGRLYKTGDLARYRADGNIEYLGRIDDQVKIRGFRIELGEIEAVLHEHPLVREARVVVHEDISGDRRLAAYIVCAEKADSGLQQLREYLSDKLPNYMVPAIIKLEKLPLTANGKLDRRALPPPELSKKQDTPVEETRDGSRDAVEQVLAEVWTEVLGIQEIGNYDNFFDLGGHSLTAIQVVARVKTRLGLQIKPRQLAFQTLAQLAAVCKEQLHPNEVS